MSDPDGVCDTEEERFRSDFGVAITGSFVTGSLAIFTLATKQPVFVHVTRQAAKATAVAAALSIRSGMDLVKCYLETP